MGKEKDAAGKIAAGVAGAMVGAAAGAAAVYLSKEENVRKVKNKINSLKATGKAKLSELNENVNKNELEKAQVKFMNEVHRAKEKVEDIQEKAAQKADDVGDKIKEKLD